MAGDNFSKILGFNNNIFGSISKVLFNNKRMVSGPSAINIPSRIVAFASFKL